MSNNLSDAPVLITSLMVQEINQALLFIQERLAQMRGLRGRTVIYDRLGADEPTEATDVITMNALDLSQIRQYLEMVSTQEAWQGAVGRLQAEVQALMTLVAYQDTPRGSTASGGAPVDAQYVTLATDATLTAERVLTAGVNVLLTDAGAGTTVTVDVGSQTFLLPGDISPAQLTANQDDYNPSGLSTASTLRLSTDASRNLTGIQGGADGRMLILHNIGAFNLVLIDDATSTAANRFRLNGDVTLEPDDSCLLRYDATVVRWRLVGRYGVASITGGAANKVAYWTSATALSNDTSLHWDSTNNVLGLGVTAAGAGANMIFAMQGVGGGLTTVPTAGITDGVQLYAQDLGAGLSSLGITTEESSHHVLGRSWLLGTRTVSSSMTRGLYIEQEGSDNGALQLGSSTDVAHGMTSLGPTSMYADFRKFSGADGGLQTRALSEGTIATSISSIPTTTTTSKTGTADGALLFEFGKKDTTGVQGMAADENLIVVQDRFAGGNYTKLIFDNDGDLLIDGGYQGKRTVEISTAGTGAPEALNSFSDANKIFINTGVTALNAYTLPSAATGYTFTFYVQDADGIRVTAAAGDTIRIATNVSAAAGRIDSSTVGDSVTLVAINTTEWVAIALVGAGWVVT